MSGRWKVSKNAFNSPGIRWHTVWMGKIINEVAKEYDLEPAHVKEIFLAYWYNTKEVIKELEYPSIWMEFFGKLRPRPKMIEKNADKYRNMRNAYENKGKPKLVEKYDELYQKNKEAALRVRNEQKRRRLNNKKNK